MHQVAINIRTTEKINTENTKTVKPNNLINQGYSEDVSHVYNGDEQHPLFTSCHTIPKNNRITIRPDLEKLDLPVNIVDVAEEVYIEMEAGTKRGSRRRQLIFFCAKTAYDKENIPIDPAKLADICGIKHSDISRALSMCSSIKTNYYTPLVKHHPQEYIQDYYDELSKFLNFDEDALEEVYYITEEVLESEPDLLEEKPQIVAAAILVYYLNLNGLTIEKNKYTVVFGRSDMTINKIKKKVSEAYNS